MRATKAPPSVVEEFETTSLVGNPMYNRVYLRLFVRSYAEIVGIRADDALNAVEDMLSGTYAGRMAQLYLENSETSPEDLENPVGEEGAMSGAVRPTPPADLPAGKADAGPVERAPGDALGSSEGKATDAAAKDRPKDTTKKSPSQGPDATTSPAAMPMATTAASIPSSSERRGPAILMPDSGSAVRALGAVFGVLAILITAWLLWPAAKAPDPAPVVSTPETVQAPVPVLPPRVVLADTVLYSVVAARDTLNPFIVNADEAFLDGRWVALSRASPIWVQFRDTLQVRVTDVFEIQRHTDDVDVLLLGQPVPLELILKNRRISFSRGAAQAYLDSVRTAGGLPGE